MAYINYRTTKDYGLLLVLLLLEIARGAFFLTFLPVYTLQGLDYGVTVAGFATSAHYLMETLCKSAAGWQYDRRGKPVLLAGMFIGLLAMLAIKLHSTPAVIIIASGLFGMAISPVWPGVLAEVAPVNHKNRSFRIGIVFTTWLGGTGAGLVGINFLLFAGFGVALNIIISILAAALAATAFIVIADRGEFRPGRLSGPRSGLLETIRQLVNNQMVTKIIIPGMFLQTLSASLLVPVLPVFARTKLGLNHDGYGMLLLAGGAATVIFLLPMGRIADKIKLRSLLSAGFAATSIALGSLALLAGKTTAFYFVVLAGISYAAVLPAWNSLLSKAIPPERQATGWGSFATVEGLGTALGPALGGIVGSRLGPAFTILITAGLLMAMSLFYMLYPVENAFHKNGK